MTAAAIRATTSTDRAAVTKRCRTATTSTIWSTATCIIRTAATATTTVRWTASPKATGLYVTLALVGCARSSDPPVAVLELLARAAGAGRVARDLAPGRGIVGIHRGPRRRPRPVRRGDATAVGIGRIEGRIVAHPAGQRRILVDLLHVGRHLRHRRLLHAQLQRRQQADHLLAQAGQEVVEEIERLALVLVQRVLLAVRTQADALAQMVEMEQVLLPALVEELHQHALLDLAPHVRPV